MSGDHPHTEDASMNEDKPAQVSVSEQDQENVHDSEEQEEDVDSVAESPSSVGNRFTVLSEEQKPKDDTVDDEQTSDAGQEDEEQEEDEDNQLVDKMEKVNLDDAFLQNSDGGEEAAAAAAEEGEDGQPEEDKEYTVVNQDPALAFQTLAGRTAPEKQECSVKSSLFQFTEVETLTQNNSLLCVTCTKRQPSKVKAQGTGLYYGSQLSVDWLINDELVSREFSWELFFLWLISNVFWGCADLMRLTPIIKHLHQSGASFTFYPPLVLFCAGAKNIYTDASKQMLISSPPPVLTLHLKRFQQVRHVRFKLFKVNQG